MEPASAAKQTDLPASPFEARALGFRIDDHAILDGIDLAIQPGLVTGLIGHNGSGKSTLIKLMAGQIKPSGGALTFAGKPVTDWPERTFARHVAYLPQQTPGSVGLTVRELVRLGRYPWHGALGRFGSEDQAHVEEAIRQCGMTDFADRMVDTLSGGERQRAWIAMCLAQNPDCLLLDEPTSALDIAHQIEVLALVRRLCHERGLTAIVVLHDVNMAARFCDRLHALKAGRLIAGGTPETIMTQASLSAIYGVEMEILAHPTLGIPIACAG
ncbi:ABC transporter ATP-binding protein [Amorphus orientalis]|uniref:Iron complex transport system ATP-binding protein n=1 Tax=Amorphus orientalis TaxID=649198 RepID=A0AAE4ATW7_9HYPH|nr:ATP-binding cassette domain-containing protein [Amorphus orientalis]MDQ0315359.1 iron complex transport system ATP-binding protein [Amorphus orientalis]